MAGNVFLNLFDDAPGESNTKGKEKWIEVHGWEWSVDAETSWTKGGGASVGKPSPGAFSWDHYFDLASPVLLRKIATGTHLVKAELQAVHSTGSRGAETYFTMLMEDVFITNVRNSGGEDGMIVQHVEMVFKNVTISYRPQDMKTGALGAAKTFGWDIAAGTVAP